MKKKNDVSTFNVRANSRAEVRYGDEQAAEKSTTQHE